VKGLVFNLLDRLARNAGCSDAVWGLVADFAATEAQINGTQLGSIAPAPSPTTSPFAVSAEALIHCFAANREQVDDEGLPDLEFEPDGDWALAEGLEDTDEGMQSQIPARKFELTLGNARGFQRNAFVDWNRLAGLPGEDDD
jgi:hypothetical protein